MAVGVRVFAGTGIHTYDGAGAMAGKSKGVASYIITKQPNALYTHCTPYRLNLCVVKSCSI